MKSISVVVPCYNVCDYLDVCMEHLLQQTIGRDNIEIILVDDASTDDGATWEHILKYERDFSDVVIAIHLDENMRQGGARNVGITYAGGEYLLFCDADDWLAYEALEHLYRAAKQWDADIVEFGKKSIRERKPMDTVAECGDKSRLFIVDTVREKKERIINDYNHFPFGCWTKLYRLSLIKEQKIAFAEHMICEEPSFTLPALLYESRHYFLDETLYFYYKHAGSTVTGDWGSHKWDNAKVWLSLVDDLAGRGLLEQYYEEMEYLFVEWYMGLSLKMWCQKGYYIQKEEIQILRNAVLQLFPNVLQNQYFTKKSSEFLQKLFYIEITDESTEVINQILQSTCLKPGV